MFPAQVEIRSNTVVTTVGFNDADFFLAFFITDARILQCSVITRRLIAHYKISELRTVASLQPWKQKSSAGVEFLSNRLPPAVTG